MRTTRDDEPNKERLDRYIEDVEARQRNVLWPDTLKNAKSVDKLIFVGSTTASPIQRIGMLLFAFSFIGIGLVLLVQDFRAGSAVGIFVDFIPALLGVIVLVNALRKPLNKK
jgi:preprotein translocase subunit SecF